MTDFRVQLKQSLGAGVKKGWISFVWMMKIVIPITFLVTLFEWSGWLYRIDFLLKPLMVLINLPGEAVLPIIIGLLTGIYGVIAAIAVLPFTIEQMTLIAIFSLTAHNLITEGIIQKKSGINLIKITLIRIAAAALTVLVVSQFFDETTRSIVTTDLIAHAPLLEVLKVTAIDMLKLSAKIFGIIMAIMIALECLTSLGWIEKLVRPLRPLMKILGLADRATTAWLTAVLFGLLYGGAVIIEEAKKGEITKGELEHLHISIGINHSMVEDPFLYVALGLNGFWLFWLFIPRLIMAIIVVQLFTAVEYLKKQIRPAS